MSRPFYKAPHQEDQIDALPGARCRRCGGDHLRLDYEYNQIEVLLIPIARVSERFTLSCRDCKAVFALPTEVGRELLKDPARTVDPAQMQPIGETDFSFEAAEPGPAEQGRCPHCGAPLPAGTRQCADCGKNV